MVPQHPVCVDLDGTLAYGHTLWQVGLSWDLGLFSPPRWPSIKQKIAERGRVDAERFSYYMPLVALLKAWKTKVPLYLVTGAPEKIALSVFEKMGLFTAYWASTPQFNLVGRKKRDLLRERFGDFGFSYVGNSWKDVPIWRFSQDVMVVRHCSWGLIPYLKYQKFSFQNFLVV